MVKREWTVTRNTAHKQRRVDGHWTLYIIQHVCESVRGWAVGENSRVIKVSQRPREATRIPFTLTDEYVGA